MTCLCDKLRREDFAALTNPERRLLGQLFAKAPQLFSDPVRQSRKKHTETRYRNSQPYRSRKVEELEKTYPCPITQRLLGDSSLHSCLRDPAAQTDTYVRIFIAVEQSDRGIALNQLLKRLHCFALAQIHPKGAPIEPIVERIKHHVGDVQNINQKIYNLLWVGRQWSKIAETMGAVTTQDRPSDRLLGVLCLLGSGSTWERASDEAREVALRRLCKKTELHGQAILHDDLVRDLVDRILDRHSSQLRLHSNFQRSASGPQFIKDGLPSYLTGQARKVSTLASSEPLAASKAAVQEIIPFGRESSLLLILLSFLCDSIVSVDMLSQAASPRKQWAVDGGIEIVASPWALRHDYSNDSTVRTTLDRLVGLSLISSTSDGNYRVDSEIRKTVLSTLPFNLHSFWRHQALCVAWAAIPWKYLQAQDLRMRGIVAPHMTHTLCAVRDHDGYESVPRHCVFGLVSALVEASRFPGLEWKQMTTNEARKILHCFSDDYAEDDYLELLVTQREALVHRLSKIPVAIPFVHREISSDNRRAHAAAGFVIIQEALDAFQKEELSSAMEIMDKWAPMHNTSLIEEVAIFRVSILRGRILRYQGKFEDSLRVLHSAHDLIEAQRELFYGEESGELAIELADTLQELGEFNRSEIILTRQLTRDNSSATDSVIKVSLAECFFAQKEVAKAKELCADLQSRSSLSKTARLRLCIVSAKMCHIQEDLDGALFWWTESLQAINRFPPTSGNATCVIYSSLCNVLKRQGQQELEQSSRVELGLRRWHEYITSSSS
ncbi:hypothetical protein HIM_11946 [Hirsutella minnesotensis 3608]|uniref:Uncharacterized protein n=1 Tax=Hirsutella minnesotensis 3608 TaxID=1043627 RepID=A0A0F7ZF77_9HYPO|nr:hypothetical protein HIM_11946 [Hirsutella minnesotensis 3608]